MSIINKEFYQKLDAKIDTIPSKQEAINFIKQAFEPIQKQLDDSLSTVYQPLVSQLQPYINLANAINAATTPPTSPDAVVQWASIVINMFNIHIDTIKAQIQPYLTQYEAARTVINELPNEVSALSSHLQQKLNEKGWYDVTIPSINVPTLPELPPIPSILK